MKLFNILSIVSGVTHDITSERRMLNEQLISHIIQFSDDLESEKYPFDTSNFTMCLRPKGTFYSYFNN